MLSSTNNLGTPNNDSKKVKSNQMQTIVCLLFGRSNQSKHRHLKFWIQLFFFFLFFWPAHLQTTIVVAILKSIVFHSDSIVFLFWYYLFSGYFLISFFALIWLTINYNDRFVLPSLFLRWITTTLFASISFRMLINLN